VRPHLLVLPKVYTFKENPGMKNLSLKLDDKTYEETEKIIDNMKISRNRYINNAIAFYNQLQKRKLLADKLALESRLVQKESMKILAEFEMLDDEHTAV
jgi:predicted transcriptional regulator